MSERSASTVRKRTFCGALGRVGAAGAGGVGAGAGAALGAALAGAAGCSRSAGSCLQAPKRREEHRALFRIFDFIARGAPWQIVGTGSTRGQAVREDAATSGGIVGGLHVARQVGEVEHLGLLCHFTQDLERRHRAVLVELHEQIVQNQRQRIGGVQGALEAGQAERQEELSPRATRQLGHLHLLLAAYGHELPLAEADREAAVLSECEAREQTLGAREQSAPAIARVVDHLGFEQEARRAQHQELAQGVGSARPTVHGPLLGVGRVLGAVLRQHLLLGGSLARGDLMLRLDFAQGILEVLHFALQDVVIETTHLVDEGAQLSTGPPAQAVLERPHELGQLAPPGRTHLELEMFFQIRGPRQSEQGAESRVSCIPPPLGLPEQLAPALDLVLAAQPLHLSFPRLPRASEQLLRAFDRRPDQQIGCMLPRELSKELAEQRRVPTHPVDSTLHFALLTQDGRQLTQARKKRLQLGRTRWLRVAELIRHLPPLARPGSKACLRSAQCSPFLALQPLVRPKLSLELAQGKSALILGLQLRLGAGQNAVEGVPSILAGRQDRFQLAFLARQALGLPLELFGALVGFEPGSPASVGLSSRRHARRWNLHRRTRRGESRSPGCAISLELESTSGKVRQPRVCRGRVHFQRHQLGDADGLAPESIGYLIGSPHGFAQAAKTALVRAGPRPLAQELIPQSALGSQLLLRRQIERPLQRPLPGLAIRFLIEQQRPLTLELVTASIELTALAEQVIERLPGQGRRGFPQAKLRCMPVRLRASLPHPLAELGSCSNRRGAFPRTRERVSVQAKTVVAAHLLGQSLPAAAQVLLVEDESLHVAAQLQDFRLELRVLRRERAQTRLVRQVDQEPLRTLLRSPQGSQLFGHGFRQLVELGAALGEVRQCLQLRTQLVTQDGQAFVLQPFQAARLTERRHPRFEQPELGQVNVRLVTCVSLLGRGTRPFLHRLARSQT